SAREVPWGAALHLAAWLRSPRSARLRQLKLGTCPEWPLVLRAVAESRHLGRLEHLERGWGPESTPPPQDVVMALARSRPLPRLRFVTFAFWHEYPEPTKAELRRRFPEIPLE